MTASKETLGPTPSREPCDWDLALLPISRDPLMYGSSCHLWPCSTNTCSFRPAGCTTRKRTGVLAVATKIGVSGSARTREFDSARAIPIGDVPGSFAIQSAVA